jgi:hypothetical protein
MKQDACADRLSRYQTGHNARREGRHGVDLGSGAVVLLLGFREHGILFDKQSGA